MSEGSEIGRLVKDPTRKPVTIGETKIWGYKTRGELRRTFRENINQLEEKIEKQSEKIDKLEVENIRDPLTGLFNKSYFEEVLQSLGSTEEPFILVIFDIDDFKKTNDTHGHATGDNVLRNIGRILNNSIHGLKVGSKSNDIAARIGGEEFGIIFRAGMPQDVLINRCNQIREKIENTPTPVSGNEQGEGINVRQTVSIGVGIRKNGESGIDFFRRVDFALYKAKNSGKNRVEIT